jgi:hypothetical protein
MHNGTVQNQPWGWVLEESPNYMVLPERGQTNFAVFMSLSHNCSNLINEQRRLVKMIFRISTSMMRISLVLNVVLVLALYSVTLNYSTGVENSSHQFDGFASPIPLAAERNLSESHNNKHERPSPVVPDASALEEGLCAGKDGVVGCGYHVLHICCQSSHLCKPSQSTAMDTLTTQPPMS